VTLVGDVASAPGSQSNLWPPTELTDEVFRTVLAFIRCVSGCLTLDALVFRGL
jgi:hypothetical protein